MGTFPPAPGPPSAVRHPCEHGGQGRAQRKDQANSGVWIVGLPSRSVLSMPNMRLKSPFGGELSTAVLGAACESRAGSPGCAMAVV